MPEKILYRTAATATGGGRDGKTALNDGTSAIDLVVPKELGGPGGDGLNPEKLFALGYAACFMGAMRHYAAWASAPAAIRASDWTSRSPCPCPAWTPPWRRT